jgi:hypothetical protein
MLRKATNLKFETIIFATIPFYFNNYYGIEKFYINGIYGLNRLLHFHANVLPCVNNKIINNKDDECSKNTLGR